MNVKNFVSARFLFLVAVGIGRTAFCSENNNELALGFSENHREETVFFSKDLSLLLMEYLCDTSKNYGLKSMEAALNFGRCDKFLSRMFRELKVKKMNHAKELFFYFGRCG